jgi:uncharacterized protein
MKLPDTNLWLALTLSGHTHHAVAKAWLDDESMPESIAFCRSTQQSFLRLMTTASVLAVYGIDPLSNRQAWAAYEALVADERIICHPEPPYVEAIWKKLAARKTSSPKLWMDAYLAAFAIATGAQLVTVDKAFTQFADLDVMVIVA